MELDKKIVKKLQYCTKLSGQEVKALLGMEVELTDFTLEMVDGESYIDALEDAFVVTDMEISQDEQAMSYTFISPAPAILLGGTLIMLPEEEITERVKEENFDEELNDSYGEVANIIAGAYTTVFIEGFVKKLHVKKTKVALIHPLQADESELEFLHGKWWKSSCDLVIAGANHGKFDFFFPVGLFGEEIPDDLGAEVIAAGKKEEVNIEKKEVEADEWGAAAASEDVEGEEGGDEKTSSEDIGGEEGGDENVSPDQETVESDENIVDNARREFVEEIEGSRKAFSDPDCLAAGNIVLVVSDSEEEVAVFDEVLKARSVDVKVAGLRDNFRDITEGHGVLGVVVVLDEVSSKGIATIIKVQSELSSRTPLLAAAPEWTKAMVLQAAQYGVKSIVITPVERSDAEKRMAGLFRI